MFCCCIDTQVAASHLDTVLDKLKDILDNVGDSVFKRYMQGAYEFILAPIHLGKKIMGSHLGKKIMGSEFPDI